MTSYQIFTKINSPSDLKYLSEGQLQRYCAEMRHFLIHSVSHTGGHLASNLGVVELAVSLHRVFRSPQDQIIWDVGHQSYPHKIITGRREAMGTLRQQGGLSGFPRHSESEHDAFLTAHSSTSVSLAGGLAAAKGLLREEGRVVAVVGDGAFTGGMVYEGLNNIMGGNPIVVLNDNKMSISKNVGSVTAYLSKLRTNRAYFRWKDATKTALQAIPFVGDAAVDMVSRSKSYLKNAVYDVSFFEELGFVHLGPVDGHNLGDLYSVLSRARELDQPVFIHVETVKGRGYEKAENNPGAYHGVPSFDPRVGSGEVEENTFSDELGKYITALGRKDECICAVTAAMKYATGLHHFSHRFKAGGRFFDVGIAEQHAVTFCAALASKGLRPVFAVYSSFLQRAYDQLLHDCSIEKQHVVLAVDRAGLVGADGETHQGIFDCGFLSTIPGTVIYSPATYGELRHALKQALYQQEGLCAVRYPRGGEPVISERYATEPADYQYLPATPPTDWSLLVVTYGRVFSQVCGAMDLLETPHRPQVCSILKLGRVWPIPREALEIARDYDRVLFVEEGYQAGGIAEHFLTGLQQEGYRGEFHIRAIQNHVPQGTVQEQLQGLGLDAYSLSQRIRCLYRSGR